MARTLSLAVVAAAVLLVVAEAAPQQGRLAIGNSDITQSLRDPVYVLKQLNCVKGVTSCDRVGKQILAALPEVLVRNCAMCTPTQARNARKLVDFIEKNYPSDFRIIKARFVK